MVNKMSLMLSADHRVFDGKVGGIDCLMNYDSLSVPFSGEAFCSYYAFLCDG